MDEFEDDIFDRNIDQLDVRETPRWELSEEEPCGDSDVETLVNQKKDGKIVSRETRQAKAKALSTNAACNPSVQPIYQSTRPGPGVQSPDHRSSTSTAESVQTVLSPILLPRNLDKKKLEELVETTYQDDGDSVKDFSAAEREKRDVGQSHMLWDEDDADSIKDYTGNDRKKEEQYMERTDEAIYQRASEEHIKRPPLWHDDEVDSLRDFGQISGKQEVPSGITSQQISRVPSDEEICLSPPWIEEEECQVGHMVHPECKTYTMGKMVVEQRIQQVPPWHEDDNDFTRNYAEFWKTGSKENSRRPSNENIYLTPPWMEDDGESCGNQSVSSRTTLDGKCAIEEEARNSEIALTLPQTLQKDQQDSETEQLPGRDIVFCGEQDQHNKQTPDDTVEKGVKIDVCPNELSGTAAQPNPYIKQVLPNTMVESMQVGIPNNQTPKDLPVKTSTNISLLVRSQPTVSQHHTQQPTVPQHHSQQPTLPQQHTQQPNVPQHHTQQPTLPQQHTQQPTLPQQHTQQPTVPQHLTQQPTVPQHHTQQSVVPQHHTKQSVVPQHHIQQSALPQHPQPDVPHYHPHDDEQRCLHVYRPPLHCGSLIRKNHREHKFVAQSTDASFCEVGSTANKDIARSVSQSSLEANCYSPHDGLEGLETSSVVSFASTAATHHDLDTRIDMMQSLISLLGTHDKDDMSRTLLAMSNSKDSCAAMRQSGCLPLLIDLIHGHDNPLARRDCRARAGLSLHNIVYSNPDDRRGRREIRVLRLLEVVRAHCDSILYSSLPPHPCAERWYPPLSDYGPGPAVAALMKLSFEEDHRNAICELGGCHAVAELIEIDQKVNGDCNDFYSVSLRKYAGMTLTNLTFGNTKNKTILCKMDKTISALISQLKTTKEDELVQVSASVLRNLSWRADEVSRDALRKIGAVRALTEAAQKAQSETVLRTLLSGLWNLSAHCPENKTELCNIPGALKFFTKSLNYCSPSGNISVIESSGGILRNLSSHIAVLPECREILRENGCFQTLLVHLRSPSLRVVSNACGALWNLSARCAEDQQLLWELGAVSILKSLANSKHKAIATASAAALRNLMAVKPTSNKTTDSESVVSCSPKRCLPPDSRLLVTKQKPCGMDIQISDKHSAQVDSHHTSTKPAPPAFSASKFPDNISLVNGVQNSSHDAGHEAIGSASALDQVMANSRKKSSHVTDVQRSSSTIKRSTKATVAVDSSSMGSAASAEGRHGHLGRWSGSNDSLAHHRRHRNKNQRQDKISTQFGSAGEHSRSSSDGCAVIQLLTDSYPLQVTAKTHHRPLDSHDNTSVVSPATARRLNQWAKDQTMESIEMSQLYICTERRHTPRVAESRESLGSGSSRHRKKHSRKFRSYRDSESEREADIDSEDEKNVFGVRAGGYTNAWIKRNGKNALNQGQIKKHQHDNPNPICACKDVTNAWMRHSKQETKGICKKCLIKPKDENLDSRPVVKSRRDSSDSPLSSPNAVRHTDIDPSKRGVKVTSL